MRGLVLDRSHRVLLDESGQLPQLVSEWPERPLLAFQHFVRDEFRLNLPSPTGSLAPSDQPGRDFLFLIEADAALPTGLSWTPLPRAAGHDDVWRAYVELVLAGWEPPTRALDVFAFGFGAEMASQLAHQVTCGTKRATAGWLTALERQGATIPTPGLLSLVTDGFGVARCVIRTLETDRARLAEVSAEFAQLEGEGDLTLEDWRDGHRWFFEAEAERLGLVFTPDEWLLLERFEVIHIVGRLPK
jgi:uncharacterized protein YhfF